MVTWFKALKRCVTRTVAGVTGAGVTGAGVTGAGVTGAGDTGCNENVIWSVTGHGENSCMSISPFSLAVIHVPVVFLLSITNAVSTCAVQNTGV